MRSANFDGSIADEDRAVLTCTPSSDDAISGPARNCDAEGVSADGVDGAVDGSESLHEDVKEDCLESSGRTNTAFGSGSSEENVGLIDRGREKFDEDGIFRTLCSTLKFSKLNVGSTLKAAYVLCFFVGAFVATCVATCFMFVIVTSAIRGSGSPGRKIMVVHVVISVQCVEDEQHRYSQRNAQRWTSLFPYHARAQA